MDIPIFSSITKVHQIALKRKFRVGHRIVDRCRFITAHEIPLILKERPLESYMTRYLQKPLNRVFKSDLEESFFHNDRFN
jgi:hypothetical protein